MESIPSTHLTTIFQLPRHSLLQDLCKVLEDTLRRYRYFETKASVSGEWPVEQLSFTNHAFCFLGILGDASCLPVVLDMFRQGKEAIGFWFGDELEEIVHPYFSRIAGDQLAVLQQFMREPYVDTYPKTVVQNCVAQVAWRNRKHLTEVSDWFSGLFDYYLARLNDKSIIDSDLIAWMAVAVGELGLKELLPKLEMLFEQKALSEDIIGEWKKLVDLFHEPLDEYHIEPLPRDIYECYTGVYLDRKKKSNQSTQNTDLLKQIKDDPYSHALFNLITDQLKAEKNQEVKPKRSASTPQLAPQVASPSMKVTVSPKIGRNEPCSCGSGRKYKYCCGK